MTALKSLSKSAPVRIALLSAAALALAACASRVETRGNELRIEEVGAIEPGKHSRASVYELLGSPSSASSFAPETWYYIYESTETTAFLEPEVTDRRIVAIEFDEQGVVKSVNLTGKEEGQEIQPAEGATPTAGNRLGFFEQILSNLGRFNKK